MRLALRYIVFSGIAFVMPAFASLLLAQERCGTDQYTKSLYANPALRKIEFEQWLTTKKLQKVNRQGREKAAPYQIPVVVHIIHNGEAIGVGANISDAQVLSQIDVLNADFRRENADAANTPPVFASVAGSLDITFVLAKRDPDGMATNGIVRVDGGRSGWTANDNYAMKSLSYWPAEQYMNIWVCNLTDIFVGYAQFPESDLEGLEASSTNRLTDGIVIWHKAFGSADDGAFSLDPTFNKGRTTTHETGHFLGLHHIWGGDGSDCGDTDYVSDTPNQGGKTEGCPSHPRTDGCGQVVMFQNFLDYTDDACMNLFSQGQVDRIVTVLENSPRRNSLLTSPGLQEPAPVANDLGIRNIVFPDASVCTNSITPVIELRNYGSNVVTSARIRFVLDGTTQETTDFPLSLGPLETANVSFTTLPIPSGTHDIVFQVLLTNGGTDGASYNDSKSSVVIVPAFASAPFALDFNTQPTGWITHNPDGYITWQIATAPDENAANKALKLNYFDYEDKIGELDVFLSPVIDLSSSPAATLTFDVAHARFQASNDRLKVVILSNCQTIDEGVVVYNKAGDSLKTAPSTVNAFVPSGPTQWRRELINLSDYVGADKIQIAFVGINDWGNNIYIDNISFFTEETDDASLAGLDRPSIVTCDDQVTPRIRIQNRGSNMLNALEISYALNGGPTQTLVLSGLALDFGKETLADLPVGMLSQGENTLAVTLSDPNGNPDFNFDDNEGTFTIVVNQSQDRIPLRENFEGEFLPTWTTVNPAGGMNWETIATNFGQSIYFNAYNNNVPGDEAWLVSPVLDFSGTQQASLLFDLSYAARNTGRGELMILGSTDCGNTFEEISYNFPQAAVVDESWMPADEDDWNRNVAVNLNALAGNENVRIAFVVRNEQGNNLYLDNIEFYVTGDPDPIDIGELYSVYGYDLANPEWSNLKITFNLPERQDVRFSLINATGQMETDGILSDVLNQTHPLNLSRRLPPGVYFIRLQIGGKFYTSKVLVY